MLNLYELIAGDALSLVLIRWVNVTDPGAQIVCIRIYYLQLNIEPTVFPSKIYDMMNDKWLEYLLNVKTFSLLLMVKSLKNDK